MYIKKIIIICEYCPRLITQNKQTKMRIMRMLALLNVAKSEVYLQEYKLSLARDLVLSKWIISTMLEKSNGPFSRSTICTTHYSQKEKRKKEQPNGPKVHMKWKEVGSCSPNSEALEDCALLIDVGFVGQKLTCYKPTKMGLEQLLPYGSDCFFFFFFISIVTW